MVTEHWNIKPKRKPNYEINIDNKNEQKPLMMWYTQSQLNQILLQICQKLSSNHELRTRPTKISSNISIFLKTKLVSRQISKIRNIYKWTINAFWNISTLQEAFDSWKLHKCWTSTYYSYKLNRPTTLTCQPINITYDQDEKQSTLQLHLKFHLIYECASLSWVYECASLSSVPIRMCKLILSLRMCKLILAYECASLSWVYECASLSWVYECASLSWETWSRNIYKLTNCINNKFNPKEERASLSECWSICNATTPI